jgi:ornithine cyclodeaminase/alanine dehydrogenase-like protein (mu-crystallin family)
MVDDSLTAPEDDYDLLTQQEAGRRLNDNINQERQRCGDSQGAEAELHRLRIAELEDAVRRHRECRPADRPTFFNATGHLERVRTAKH